MALEGQVAIFYYKDLLRIKRDINMRAINVSHFVFNVTLSKSTNTRSLTE